MGEVGEQGEHTAFLRWPAHKWQISQTYFSKDKDMFPLLLSLHKFSFLLNQTLLKYFYSFILNFGNILIKSRKNISKACSWVLRFPLLKRNVECRSEGKFGKYFRGFAYSTAAHSSSKVVA